MKMSLESTASGNKPAFPLLPCIKKDIYGKQSHLFASLLMLAYETIEISKLQTAKKQDNISTCEDS